MHPKYKRKLAKAKASAGNNKAVSSEEGKDIRARKFPGLSVPDQEWKPAEKYLADRDGKEVAEKLPESISMDGTMAELAAVAARRNRPSAADFLGDEPSSKRPRYGNDSAIDHQQGYSNGSRNYHQDGDRGRSRPTIDSQPIMYKIYNGVVQNVRDFGAFVSLEGVHGRVEGE